MPIDWRRCWQHWIDMRVAENSVVLDIARSGKSTALNSSLDTMRDKIAVFGGPPVFEQPLQIVRPTFPPVDSFLPAFQAALATGK